jgi:hypothetical protein
MNRTGKILAAAVIVLALSVVALVWFFPSTGDFRADNPFWNGLSDFSTSTNATVLTSTSSIPINSTGCVLVEIPYASFDNTYLSQLSQFVTNGGTLLVMDDYGQGNQILSYLGVSVRFSGERLVDPLFNYQNSLLPRISYFAYPLNVTGDIVMNYATALVNVSSPANTLAWSSGFSFLDMKGNLVESAGDPVGPLPVIAYEKLGSGYVVAVSDPSILINSMLGIDGNSALASKLVAFAGTPDHIYIDQSHLPVQPLDEAKATLSQVYAAVSTPMGTLALIALVVALSTMPLWLRKGRG